MMAARGGAEGVQPSSVSASGLNPARLARLDRQLAGEGAGSGPAAPPSPSLAVPGLAPGGGNTSNRCAAPPPVSPLVAALGKHVLLAVLKADVWGGVMCTTAPSCMLGSMTTGQQRVRDGVDVSGGALAATTVPTVAWTTMSPSLLQPHTGPAYHPSTPPESARSRAASPAASDRLTASHVTWDHQSTPSDAEGPVHNLPLQTCNTSVSEDDTRDRSRLSAVRSPEDAACGSGGVMQ